MGTRRSRLRIGGKGGGVGSSMGTAVDAAALRRPHQRRMLTPSAPTGRPGAQLLSLNNSIRQLTSALQRLGEPSVTVEQKLYEELDPILGDPSGLERMIMALARSARDAMPKGGTLTFETDTVFLDSEFVSRWAGMKPGPYSMMMVRDTRPVRRDSAASVAEPSSDLEEAKIIAERSGGRLDLEMVPGTGRIVRVYFSAIDPDGIGVVAGQSRPGAE